MILFVSTVAMEVLSSHWWKNSVLQDKTEVLVTIASKIDDWYTQMMALKL
jgi:hypothetical protein